MSKNFNYNSIDDENAKAGINRQDQYIDDSVDDEYEEGEVSGFVMQKPLPHGDINMYNPNIVSRNFYWKHFSERIDVGKCSFQNLQADAKSGNFIRLLPSLPPLLCSH